MSALSNAPAKESMALGGGAQNHPQSHQPAPPSVTVSNSGVFSHRCFMKTTCKCCLKITLLTPPSWRTRQNRRTRTKVHQTERKVLDPLETSIYLKGSWPLVTPTFIIWILHPQHNLSNGDHFHKAFDHREAIQDGFQHLTLSKLWLWANLSQPLAVTVYYRLFLAFCCVSNVINT